MKRIMVALSMIGALVLSGCSKMDLAASVDGQEISLATLQSNVDSILAEREKVDPSQMQLQVGEDLTRAQLSFFIGNVIIDSIAADQGIDITDSDIESYRLQVIQNIGGEEMLPRVLVNAAIAPDSLITVLRRDLIFQKLTDFAQASGADDAGVNQYIEGLLKDKATALKIEVNPRYGTWDPTSLSVIKSENTGDAVTDN